jgi:hypothetical protein
MGGDFIVNRPSDDLQSRERMLLDMTSPTPTEAQPAGLAAMKSLDDYTLEDHLEGPHEWGYRDPVTGDFISDDRPYEAAKVLRALRTQPQAEARPEAPVDAVEAAFREGYEEGRANGEQHHVPDDAWRVSKARAALSEQPRASGVVEVEFEVWQDDMLVASSTSEADARHYLAVYSQDGPATLMRSETRRSALSHPRTEEGK